MTAWKLPGVCQTTSWRLPDDCLTTAWQLPDDCLIRTLTYPSMTIGSMVHKILNILWFAIAFRTTKITEFIHWVYIPWIIIIFDINWIHLFHGTPRKKENKVVLHSTTIVCILGLTLWNLSCLEFKFDDTRLSYWHKNKIGRIEIFFVASWLC